jgi:hypothetical protein
MEAYHLKSDNTTANDNHLLGNLLQCNCTSAGYNLLLVDGETRERCSFRAGSDDNVLCADSLLATLEQVDFNLVFTGDGAGTLNVIHAVLFEEVLDTLRQAGDGGVLRLHHLGEVEFYIAN